MRALRHLHGTSNVLRQVLAQDPDVQLKKQALYMLLDYRAPLSVRQWADTMHELIQSGTASKSFGRELEDRLPHGHSDLTDALVSLVATTPTPPPNHGTTPISWGDGVDPPLCSTCNECLNVDDQQEWGFSYTLGNSEGTRMTGCKTVCNGISDAADAAACAACLDQCNCRAIFRANKVKGVVSTQGTQSAVAYPEATGVKQMFEPKHFRAGFAVGNDKIGMGVYGSVLAEGCRFQAGDTAEWAGKVRAEAGI